VSARLLAAAALALAGCATAQQTPTVATPSAVTASRDAAPRQLCALDALRWSLGFVPRATNEECVTILETVKIGQ